MLELQVLGSLESENRSVGLSGQGRSLTFRQKFGRMNRSTILINEHYLPALLLDRRRLDRIAEAITQSDRRLYPPGIVDIQVVSLNRASDLRLLTEGLDR